MGTQIVYVAELCDDRHDGPVKIGITANLGTLASRIQTYRDNGPYEVRLLGVIYNASRKTEMKIHDQLSRSRIKGEWFQLSHEVIDFITDHTEAPPDGPWNRPDPRVHRGIPLYPPLRIRPAGRVRRKRLPA